MRWTTLFLLETGACRRLFRLLVRRSRLSRFGDFGAGTLLFPLFLRLFRRRRRRVPSAAQCLVELYERDVFIPDGIAESYLCIEILALCVQHVEVVDDAVDVLQPGELHVFARGLFEIPFQDARFAGAVVAHDGVVHLLKDREYLLFVPCALLFVGVLLGPVFGAFGVE